jgi:dGTPase
MYKRYDALLAPYAIQHSGDHGRAHQEDEHPNKLPFQRDRDRIIHSKAFRRLKHKTQVIVNPSNDHYRDRLTHSIEGSQVARSICRSLRLNEDLAEAAILAHDLGHPPFGHEGEYALHELLEPLGYSFDHNEHSFRIVTKLEKAYPDFDGLNLTQETLAAIQKHHVPWEQEDASLPHKASLEAQIVNLADEIAYYSHDIDDGLRAGILNLEELHKLTIGQMSREIIARRYGDLPEDSYVYRPQLVRSVVHLLVTDIIENTRAMIAKEKIESTLDIYDKAMPIANYSAGMDDATQELRSFLYKNFYHSKPVRKHTDEGRELLKELFTRLYEEPRHLPQRRQKMIESGEPKAIVVKDYIAGMTDNFAKEIVTKLRKRLI